MAASADNGKSVGFLGACREAAVCLGLGVGTLRSARLLMRSAAIGALVGAIWVAMFWQHFATLFDLALACAATLVVGLLLPLGVVTQYALLPTPPPVTTSTLFGSSLGTQTYNFGAQLLNIGTVLAYVLAFAAAVLVLLWVLAYVLTSGIVGRLLYGRTLQAHVARAYPSLDAATRFGARPRPRRLARATLVVGLLVPFVSLGLLLGLLCYGMVRVFFRGAVAHALTPAQRTAVLRNCVGASVLLGAMLLCMALLPVVNLLTPMLGAAAATHLYRREAGRAMARSAACAPAAARPAVTIASRDA